MSSASYEALIRVVLDKTGLQSQINSATKSAKMTMKADLDQRSLEIVLQKWKNKVETLKITKPAIFNNKDVQEQLRIFDNLTIGVKNGTVALQELPAQWSNVQREVSRAGAAMKGTVKDGYAMNEMLSVAAKKVIIWGIATEAIYGSLKKIGEGIQYIRDLNKEMVNIQIVNNMSSAQIADLAMQYNGLAKELGTTTLEVVKGSLEWIRQGKSIAETQTLLRASTMMSKLANMDSAAATTTLTATLNAYKLEAKDATSVLDVLVNLDNNYATSVQEISDAMQRSASVAKQAGVGYKDLASYITVISSVTRLASDSIGQSLKTIFQRMEQVKLGKKLDEEGEDISNVEKALRTQGIEVRKNAYEFRDMDDVLSDVAKKYKELGLAGKTVEQSMMVQTMAGLRQGNMLTALLNNWDMVTEAQNTANTSAGLASQRYEKYLLGVEAAANRLSDSWQLLWQQMLPPEKIAQFYNFWADVLSTINGARFATSKSQQTTYTFLTNQLKALESQKADLDAMGLEKGVSYVNPALDAAIIAVRESLNELSDSFKKTGDVATDSASDIDGYNKVLADTQILARMKATEDLDGIMRQYLETQKEVPPVVGEVVKSIEELTTAADTSSASFFSSNSMLESVLADYGEYGQITIDQAYKMIDAGYAAALAINVETGAITINKQVLRELAILKAQDAEATAWAVYQEQDAANKRMAIVIPSILAETAALLAKANALHGITTLLQKTPEAITIPTPFISPAVGGGGGGSSENKAEQEYQKLLDETIKKIKDKKNAQKDALKAELDAYKKIIDAAKDLLDQKKDERNYTKQVEEQSKTIADIQEELLELQFDNSAEANAKRLELQEQLVEAQGELEDTQYDRSIDVQKEALNKEYEDYKSGIDARINELELYLADTERITQDAIRQIGKAGQDMVSAMGGAIASGISQVNAYAQTVATTIGSGWAAAQDSMEKYYHSAAYYSTLGSGWSGMPPEYEIGSGWSVWAASQDSMEKYYHSAMPGVPSYDDGGIVSGIASSKSGVVFAQLLKGEVVATDDMMRNFINRTLPKISSTIKNDSNITISMPISIAGNLDRSVLPDMEKMVLKTVNNAIKKRGVVRNANSFSV